IRMWGNYQDLSLSGLFFLVNTFYSNIGVPNDPCVFPFIYRDRTFHTCTNENSEDGRFWCATTGNYDKDKQWRYCAESSKSEIKDRREKLGHFKSS
uniref:Fibronectin type-II domain-containing protein n=1 Tax=Anolis carolinensis TaxID=28377 RepID=A0A803T6M6_ANOCA